MTGAEDNRTITDWRTASRFYRKSPGAAWLLALIAIPLLLGLDGVERPAPIRCRGQPDGARDDRARDDRTRDDRRPR